MNPLISVIIPNYNHAAYLNKRIESVLNQTYSNYEVILLDDCSTDHSIEILESYRLHPKVSHVLINQKNSGSPFNQWDKGINHARGAYIWIAESDDYAEKNFLETIMGLFQKDERIGIAYCQSWGVDESNNITKSWVEWTNSIDKERWKYEFINKGANELAKYFAIKNTLPNASAIVFKRDLYTFNGLKSNMRLCGDKMAWTQMLLKTYLAYSPLHLNYFRTHNKSVRTNIKSILNLYENFIWYNFLKSKVNVPLSNHNIVKKWLYTWWIALLKIYTSSNTIKLYIKILFQALRTDKSLFKHMIKAMYRVFTNNVNTVKKN